MGLFLRRLLLPPLPLICVCAFAAAAAADPAEERARAEALALARYHEGFPPEYGERITAVGAARLAELLADPDAARHHATIVEALGASGRPGAFEALVAFEAEETGDAVDAARFRALRAVPIAMGRLARDDDRALAWLASAAAERGPAGFRADRLDAARVGERLRRHALYGLAISGRAEALPALEGAAAEGAPGAARAIGLHADSAAERAAP